MKKGLIGEKLGHSYSKIIHERIADYEYELISLNQSEFQEFMINRQFDAINVTIPYKEKVIPYLDELDESAKAVMAVNTIVNRNGKLIGYNTDTYGFDYTLKAHQIDVEGKKVVVLGNGGAAKAICSILKKNGAREIIKVKKNPSPETIFYEECYDLHDDASVLVNTSPVGMFPNNEDCPIDLDRFDNLEAVVDIIYNPLKTRLLVEAEKRGMKAVSGLEMLVAQAKKAVEYFCDTTIDDEVIEEITHDLIHQKQNLVLIGMPSSGKTTIGKALSQSEAYDYADMDDEIIKKIKMPISDFFKLYGEEKFREIETEVAKNLSKRSHLIISTGGGVVKKEENLDVLRQNGIILFIKRDLEKLISDPSRPLSSTLEAVKRLYEERMPLYEKYGEVEIENNNSIEHTVYEIQQYLKRRAQK